MQLRKVTPKAGQIVLPLTTKTINLESHWEPHSDRSIPLTLTRHMSYAGIILAQPHMYQQSEHPNHVMNEHV